MNLLLNTHFLNPTSTRAPNPPAVRPVVCVCVCVRPSDTLVQWYWCVRQNLVHTRRVVLVCVCVCASDPSDTLVGWCWCEPMPPSFVSQTTEQRGKRELLKDKRKAALQARLAKVRQRKMKGRPDGAEDELKTEEVEGQRSTPPRAHTTKAPCRSHQ